MRNSRRRKPGLEIPHSWLPACLCTIRSTGEQRGVLSNRAAQKQFLTAIQPIQILPVAGAAKESRSVAQICEAFLEAGSEGYKKEGSKYVQRFLSRRKDGRT
jgi:hypothetical protein